MKIEDYKLLMVQDNGKDCEEEITLYDISDPEDSNEGEVEITQPIMHLLRTVCGGPVNVTWSPHSDGSELIVMDDLRIDVRLGRMNYKSISVKGIDKVYFYYRVTDTASGSLFFATPTLIHLLKQRGAMNLHKLFS